MDRNAIDLDHYPDILTVPVVLDGRTWDVGPFRGRSLVEAIKLARPLLGYFAAFQETGEQKIDWAYIIENYYDRICAVIDLTLGWPVGTSIEKLEANQVADMMLAIVTVNLDFFSQRLQPSLGRLTQEIAAQASPSERSGSGSSPVATRRRQSWLTRLRNFVGGSGG